MEELFAYGYYQTKEQQSDRADNRGNGSGIDRTDTAPVSASDIGTVQQNSGILFDSWEQHCKKHGSDIRTSDASGFEQSDRTDVKAVLNGNAQGGNRQDVLDRVFNQGQIIVADRLLERAAAHGNMSNDERAEGQGFDTVEAQAEMGGDWSNIAVDAADIATIGEMDNNDKQKPKVVCERKRGQKKKQIQDSHDDGDMQMNM